MYSKSVYKRKPYIKKVSFLFCVLFRVCLAILILFSPLSTYAAILYLVPQSQTIYEGETIITEIRVDTEGENINSVEAKLSFPAEFLEVKDFSTGNSILTFWVNGPQIDQESGTISFSGAIPGGYSGRLPGDPGESNLLGKIIFKVHKSTQNGTQINTNIEFLDSSQVLLNDGFGTPAKLTTQGAIFTILTDEKEGSKDQWREEIEKDRTPPEPFKIELAQDPSIFEGKHFIIFSTTDKQTGIAHYKISEARDEEQDAWKTVESPYLLEDQNLRSIIKVKAVDKAGNERIEALESPYKAESRNLIRPWGILIGIGIFILLILLFLIKKFYTLWHNKK